MYALTSVIQLHGEKEPAAAFIFKSVDFFFTPSEQVAFYILSVMSCMEHYLNYILKRFVYCLLIIILFLYVY